MPTTYLDLTNKLLRRFNEVELTETTFASSRNIQSTAKDAIIDAIDEINMSEHEWPFNSGTGTQVLTIGQELYDFVTLTTTVDWESFRIQRDDALDVGTEPLKFINQDTWYKRQRKFDDDAGTTGLNVPKYVFRTNNGGFGISPSPDKAYTVLYNRFIEPTRMADFDSVSTIPSRFDLVILDIAQELINMHKDNDSMTQLSFQQRVQRTLNKMKTMLMNKQDKMEDTRSNYGGMRYSGEFYIDDR